MKTKHEWSEVRGQRSGLGPPPLLALVAQVSGPQPGPVGSPGTCLLPLTLQIPPLCLSAPTPGASHTPVLPSMPPKMHFQAQGLWKDVLGDPSRGPLNPCPHQLGLQLSLEAARGGTPMSGGSTRAPSCHRAQLGCQQTPGLALF